MTREELFLKYIDNELSEEKKLEVEQLISTDDSKKQLFKKVKAAREMIISAVDFLNPDEPVTIPAFNTNPATTSNRKAFQIKLWHYAALAAIIAGVYFGYKILQNPKEIPIVENAPKVLEIPISNNSELDCYISPNRCWNQKKLYWNSISIN